MNLRPEAQELLERVSDFLEKEVAPNEAKFHEQIKTDEDRWNYFPEIVEELKDKAKSQGLWNLFLPESEFGAGLTNYEYAHLAEQMGKYSMGSEVFNCSAPDTGNMEVIARYGNEKHQEEWLKPLLDGEIRSCFGMTEPGVASSDATNMQATAVLDGDEYVINGEKWWTSGAGDPRCKILVFMGVTNPDNPKHQRQSQILVPMDTPGIEILRMMNVFGSDDAPHGHGHLRFTDVKVPKENLLLGEGRGFEIAQGRLGPGRIHHCMRAIGQAEVALELMVKRASTRVAFGKPIIKLGKNLEVVSRARIEIDAYRLMVLQAAKAMDVLGNKEARIYVSAVKAMVPEKVCKIIDDAIQMHGATGTSQWTPLARMYANQRTLRFADGPDEVHHMVVGRNEVRKYDLW